MLGFYGVGTVEMGMGWRVGWGWGHSLPDEVWHFLVGWVHSLAMRIDLAHMSGQPSLLLVNSHNSITLLILKAHRIVLIPPIVHSSSSIWHIPPLHYTFLHIIQNIAFLC